jgi:hypothetical protein
VDDSFRLKQAQTCEYLACESADELDGKAREVVGPDELVKIDAQRWRGDAKMVSEVERRCDC